MNKVLRSLCVAGAALIPLAANAQNTPALPQSSSGVAAVVNEAVISNYDVDQRVALFVATSGVQLTPENTPQIRAQVLRSLQDELIELQEANKRRINISRAEAEKALQDIAEDNKLTIDQLLMRIGAAGVTPATFRQQLNAQIIWQKLVTARYGTDILVTDQQVDEAMSRLKQGADRPQFLLSEIYIGVDKPEEETTVRANADRLAQQIEKGASFQTMARQVSQSPSAAEGGDVGWVLEGQLAEELDRALLGLKPGQTVGPIRAEGGYYILQLRDRREPAGTQPVQPVQATPTPDPNAPVPLDRLLIPLPANADQALRTRAIALASNIKNNVRSCGDLPGTATQLQGSVYARLGSVDPKSLDAQLRDALSKTGPGEVVEPFISPAGVEVIMRCDAPAAGSTTYELPSRAQLQQQLFLQQLSRYAQSYLRDLRRSAAVYTTGR